jgi:TonB family protein
MASPHLYPDPDNPTNSPLAPVAYNSAGQADRAPGAPVNENWKPQEGQTVEGKFRLGQKLGESDHSVVFLTERTEEPKKAAIKLIPAADAEKQLLRWKLATKLPHSHLLRIFESGQCELNGQALLYVVMEQAEEDLSQVLPHRPLTSAEARQMVLPALDALSYLHSKGFVHGRIKPSNILAIADQVKLSSDSIFAISEGVGAASECDPPEARIGKVSPATDVWALGMTLAEVLTLQKPTWDAVKRQEPVLPSELDESFRIVARNCLKLEAAERWTIAEIKSLLQPEKVPAAKITRGSKSSAWFYVIPIIVLLVFGFVVSQFRHSKIPANGQVNIEVPEQGKTSSVEPKPKPSTPAPASSSTTAANSKTSAPSSQGRQANKSATTSTPSSVVQQVLPDVPASARRTITGRIRVRVKVSVDANGNVTNAALDSPSKSSYFNRLSQQAAEKWKFSPVAGEWMIQFAYTSQDTTAKPEQLK